MTQTLILGPPGTGKTFACMEIIEKELESGVRPDKILFTTFSKKGANEGLIRACEKFNFNRNQLPYFRTLHSLAFQELHTSREDMMSFQDYKKIGSALGLDFGYVDLSEGQPVPTNNKGDQMNYTLSVAKARMVSIEEQFKDSDFEFEWFEFKRFIDTLEEYKSNRGLLDFSDLITQYIETKKSLNIDVAIIDEAQDLTKQQWVMVRQAMKNAQRVYIAGDDDQSLFRWAGADVDEFLSLEGQKQVLQKSYRLPVSVFQLANGITGMISKRYDKKWEPRDDIGSVDFVNSLDDIDIREGSNLFLARNKYLLKRYEEFLQREGMPYLTSRGSSINSDAIRAIKIWESLRKGDSVDVELIRLVYENFEVGKGVKRGFKLLKGASGKLTIDELVRDWGLLTKSIWHDALTKLDNIPYYLAVLRRGEKLDKEPRIHISTIHAVKGGEADNVVILSDLSWKTFTSFRDNPDDEHRVFYVGVTRARKTLQIVSPQTSIFYDFPAIKK